MEAMDTRERCSPHGGTLPPAGRPVLAAFRGRGPRGPASRCVLAARSSCHEALLSRPGRRCWSVGSRSVPAARQSCSQNAKPRGEHATAGAGRPARGQRPDPGARPPPQAVAQERRPAPAAVDLRVGAANS